MVFQRDLTMGQRSLCWIDTDNTRRRRTTRPPVGLMAAHASMLWRIVAAARGPRNGT